MPFFKPRKQNLLVIFKKLAISNIRPRKTQESRVRSPFLRTNFPHFVQIIGCATAIGYGSKLAKGQLAAAPVYVKGHI